MNIHANIIPSHKTTHVDNKRVTSNLLVNDIEQISFVSPVDDSNRKVADSLINDSQKINVDHNTYQNSTTSTNKRRTKGTHQLGDELDQIQIEASTLLRQDAKDHQHNANRMANDSVQIHKNFVNIDELKDHIEEIINIIQFLSTRYGFNPYVNNNDSAEGSLSQNCPIPTRISQRDQKSKRHRGLSRKRYSHYKYKKHNSQVMTTNITTKVPDVMLANVMSLVPKIDEVTEFIVCNKLNLSLITETWLKVSVPDSVIDIPGFALLRIGTDYHKSMEGYVLTLKKHIINTNVWMI